MLPESIKNYSNEIASEAAFYGEENVKRQERKLSYVKAFALKLLDPNFYPFSTNETYRRGKSEQYRLSALYRCNRFEWNQTWVADGKPTTIYFWPYGFETFGYDYNGDNIPDNDGY